MTTRNTPAVADICRPVKAATAELPSVDDVQAARATLARVLHAMERRVGRIEEILELVPLLLAATGVDPTHVSVDVAARMLHVSVPTIRRRIRRKELRLEVIAGTKCSGIPLEDIYGLWIPIRVARAALVRERAALDDLKKGATAAASHGRMK